MKHMPIFIKALINIVLLCVYTLIGVMFLDFMYGAVMTYILGKDVPGWYDPIHKNLAFIASLFVVVFTVIFRKYFYISFHSFTEETSENE